MAEPDILDSEPVRGLETHAPGYDVLQHPVMVALGDVHFAEPRREVAKEHVDVTPLPRGHLRHEMLHVSQDDESARAPAVPQLVEPLARHLAPAPVPAPLLVPLLLAPAMEV